MQTDEQEIRRLVATWMAASKMGGVDQVLSLMAPFTGQGHTLSVLKKEGGKWVMARDANLLA